MVHSISWHLSCCLRALSSRRVVFSSSSSSIDHHQPEASRSERQSRASCVNEPANPTPPMDEERRCSHSTCSLDLASQTHPHHHDHHSSYMLGASNTDVDRPTTNSIRSRISRESGDRACECTYCDELTGVHQTELKGSRIGCGRNLLSSADGFRVAMKIINYRVCAPFLLLGGMGKVPCHRKVT